ncbi:hypothetical protein BHM03_00054644, partial [Ensete ventricosum]
GVICMLARGCATLAISRSSVSVVIRDSGSIAVVLSSRGAAPADPRAVDALVAMQSFFNVDLIVMIRHLMEVRKHYFVPQEYELHTPLPGERPYDIFSSGFSLSTNALEVGLRLPPHPVIPFS